MFGKCSGVSWPLETREDGAGRRLPRDAGPDAVPRGLPPLPVDIPCPNSRHRLPDVRCSEWSERMAATVCWAWRSDVRRGSRGRMLRSRACGFLGSGASERPDRVLVPGAAGWPLPRLRGRRRAPAAELDRAATAEWRATHAAALHDRLLRYMPRLAARLLARREATGHRQLVRRPTRLAKDLGSYSQS